MDSQSAGNARAYRDRPLIGGKGFWPTHIAGVFRTSLPPDLSLSTYHWSVTATSYYSMGSRTRCRVPCRNQIGRSFARFVKSPLIAIACEFWTRFRGLQTIRTRLPTSDISRFMQSFTSETVPSAALLTIQGAPLLSFNSSRSNHSNCSRKWNSLGLVKRHVTAFRRFWMILPNRHEVCPPSEIRTSSQEKGRHIPRTCLPLLNPTRQQLPFTNLGTARTTEESRRH